MHFGIRCHLPPQRIEPSRHPAHSACDWVSHLLASSALRPAARLASVALLAGLMSLTGCTDSDPVASREPDSAGIADTINDTDGAAQAAADAAKASELSGQLAADAAKAAELSEPARAAADAAAAAEQPAPALVAARAAEDAANAALTAARAATDAQEAAAAPRPEAYYAVDVARRDAIDAQESLGRAMRSLGSGNWTSTMPEVQQRIRQMRRAADQLESVDPDNRSASNLASEARKMQREAERLASENWRQVVPDLEQANRRIGSEIRDLESSGPG